MKINMEPVASIPPYVRHDAHPVAQRTASPLLHSDTHVALRGFTPARQLGMGAAERQMVESLVKLLSDRIAENIGHHALIANKALWLCFSGFKLAAQRRHTASPWDTAFGIAGLAAGATDLVSSVAGRPGLEHAAAHIEFFVEQGEKALHGELTLGLADIAKLQGDVPATTQFVLQLMDTLAGLTHPGDAGEPGLESRQTLGALKK